METITVSEFEKEMNEIEKLQEEVSNWINSKSFFVKFFDFGLGRMQKIHDEAGRRMGILFSKELIED